MTNEQLQELKEICSKDELIGIIVSQQTTIVEMQNMLRGCSNSLSAGYNEMIRRYNQLQYEYNTLKQCKDRYIDGINKREKDLKHIRELEDKICRQRVALKVLQRGKQ